MKPRPRRVENRVAEELSAFFVQYGLSPVERIPILGREGPDITINELQLVIDVKSRKQIPDCFTISASGSVIFSHFAFGVRLGELELLRKNYFYYTGSHVSKTVARWYNHMDEWRKDKLPDGITALVLHRPGTPILYSTFLIAEKDREVLVERLDSLSNGIDSRFQIHYGTTLQTRGSGSGEYWQDRAG